MIASQAVITGAYSLVSQAIQLGLLPRLEIIHTSDSQEGQIYVPRINRILLLGVLALVLLFRSSDALANAYGIAVSGTMVATTALAFFVVWKLWHWPLWGALALICAFLSIDISFFIANLYKVLDGGWVPLLLGCATFVVMWTWSRGSAILASKTHRDSIPMTDLIKMLEKSKPVRVPGTAVFLTSDPSVAPSSFMHNLKHNKVMHERVVMMCVRTETSPRVPASQRYRNPEVVGGFLRRHAAFRLYGIAAHSDSPRGAAQGRRQVRHHDDVVLPGPAHAEAGAEFRHAEVAGSPLHRARQTGRERPGLLPHPLGPRGRTRRADEGLRARRAALTRPISRVFKGLQGRGFVRPKARRLGSRSDGTEDRARLWSDYLCGASRPEDRLGCSMNRR